MMARKSRIEDLGMGEVESGKKADWRPFGT